ncbi:MAG: branched-chain amino acid transport system permease protein livM [Ilumatobacteraceae bacterium]|jgi:branched-chain amino acid transport system permease protein
MKEIVLFVLLGLGAGAVIAGIGMAVVVTFSGSGIINLSTGAISMVAAYTFWALKSDYFHFTLATPLAVALTIAVSVVVGVLSELLVFRPLRTSSPLAKLVASLGILLTLQATILLWFGSPSKQIPSVFPTNFIKVFGTSIPANRFWMAAIVVLIALALTALYRWTRFGLATRAAAENEVYGMLAGLSPNQLSMANTVVASALAGAMGIIAAPLSQADSSTLVLFIVPALAAALFAAFRSIPIACVAGLGIGIGQSLMSYASTLSWFPTDKGQPMPGVQALLTFVLLVIALSLRGARLPTRGELVEKRLPAAPRPQRLARPALLLAVVGVVLLVVLPFGYRQSLMLSLVGVAMCLSLVVITGFVGQVSLAQVTLAGVSGFVVSHLFVHAHIGFPWGPLAGSVAAVVVGLIVGVSALRVRGVSLAVVTLAGVIAIEQFGFANSRWGAGPNGSPVGQPKLFGTAIGGNASFRGVDGKLPSPVLGFVYLAAVIALCLLVANLRRSLLGQQMLAIRANERAAAAAGINVARVKITAYAISSFIAGTAGWMYAYNFGSVSAARFGILVALGFVAFAYIGGITMVSGAVIGGLVATEGLVPHFFQSILGISGNWTLLVGGLILIVTLIQNPEGVAGTTYRKRHDARRRAAAGSSQRSQGPLLAPGGPTAMVSEQ